MFYLLTDFEESKLLIVISKKIKLSCCKWFIMHNSFYDFELIINHKKYIQFGKLKLHESKQNQQSKSNTVFEAVQSLFV